MKRRKLTLADLSQLNLEHHEETQETEVVQQWKPERLYPPAVFIPSETVIVGRFQRITYFQEKIRFIYITAKNSEMAISIAISMGYEVSALSCSREDSLMKGNLGDEYRVLRAPSDLVWEDRDFKGVVFYTPDTPVWRFDVVGIWPTMVGQTLHSHSVEKLEDQLIWEVKVKGDKYTPPNLDIREVEERALSSMEGYRWEIKGDLSSSEWGKKMFRLSNIKAVKVAFQDDHWVVTVSASVSKDCGWVSGFYREAEYNPDYGWMGNRTPW